MKRIVWMSVASALFIVVAAAAAVWGTTDAVLAAGSSAIATAILATREK